MSHSGYDSDWKSAKMVTLHLYGPSMLYAMLVGAEEKGLHVMFFGLNESLKIA